MNTSRVFHDFRAWRYVFGGALVFGLFAGCGPAPKKDRAQGYVEGEYVYVASPIAGALDKLSVQRGAQVALGDPLFALECGSETAARNEAKLRLAEGQAKLEDATKGKRPMEIDSAEAQLKQAESALVLSKKEFTRQESLFRTGAAATSDFDRARSARDQDTHRVSQLEADLKTAQMGARSDQILAAEANVRALEASLAKSEWDFTQKHQLAPKAGLVFDTLFQEGEWVPAGRPVITMLPPANVKVRAFIPETLVGRIRTGESLRVFVDGVADPFTGKGSFISPQAEYTPPVIYSQESRGKLAFMVELRFDAPTAAKLHPGQPVDVQLSP